MTDDCSTSSDMGQMIVSYLYFRGASKAVDCLKNHYQNRDINLPNVANDREIRSTIINSIQNADTISAINQIKKQLPGLYKDETLKTWLKVQGMIDYVAKSNFEDALKLADTLKLPLDPGFYEVVEFILENVITKSTSYHKEIFLPSQREKVLDIVTESLFGIDNFYCYNDKLTISIKQLSHIYNISQDMDKPVIVSEFPTETLEISDIDFLEVKEQA